MSFISFLKFFIALHNRLSIIYQILNQFTQTNEFCKYQSNSRVTEFDSHIFLTRRCWSKTRGLCIKSLLSKSWVYVSVTPYIANQQDISSTKCFLVTGITKKINGLSKLQLQNVITIPWLPFPCNQPHPTDNSDSILDRGRCQVIKVYRD